MAPPGWPRALVKRPETPTCPLAATARGRQRYKAGPLPSSTGNYFVPFLPFLLFLLFLATRITHFRAQSVNETLTKRQHIIDRDELANTLG